MKTYVYRRAHRLGKLTDELLAAIPALRPVPGSDGMPEACCLAAGDGVTVTLTVPDDVAEPAIAAIVAVHDPATPSAAEAADARRAANEAAWRTELRSLLGKLDSGAATAAEQRRTAALLVRLVVRVLD